MARGELGYAEGAQNYTKYGEWAGDPYAEWCAEFICWCVDQAQQSQGEDLLNVIYPNYSGQNTGRNWFIKRGRFVYRKGVCPDWGAQWLRDANHNLSKNEFIPRSGDLVFFSYNAAGDTDHVALIEYCSRDAEGNVYLHVIEGNNPDRVQRKVYPLDNSQVLGFGLCEDLVDTTMRSGNEGDKAWRNVSFPADVRQVITVGSCDSDGVSRSRSSGVGREDAGYVKPDFVAGASSLGTSFSTPVIAGLCACLLEYRPMERGELIGLLHASGTRAAAPGCELGYGIPQTDVLLRMLRTP